MSPDWTQLGVLDMVLVNLEQTTNLAVLLSKVAAKLQLWQMISCLVVPLGYFHLTLVVYPGAYQVVFLS